MSVKTKQSVKVRIAGVTIAGVEAPGVVESSPAVPVGVRKAICRGCQRKIARRGG